MENAMFDVYYGEFNLMIGKAKNKSDVDTVRKILEQMEVEERLMVGVQRKKYSKIINQCKQKLNEKSAEINVNKGIDEYHKGSSDQGFRCAFNENEERAIVDTNEKLILMKHMTDEIEQRGKNINTQLNANNEKFKNIIQKTDDVNNNLDGSNTVLTNMVKENSKWNFLSRIFG